MRKYHIFLNIFWIGLSIFIMALSYKLSLGRLRSPGPGLVPFLSGFLLCLVSLYSLIRSSVQKQGQGKFKEAEGTQTSLWKVLIVAISLLVYTFVFEKLGFLITTVLFLGILFAIGGGKGKWRAIVVLSVLTGVITFLGFGYLGVPLPDGILGF
jgi:putative tricarboxylic transport membrane protein